MAQKVTTHLVDDLTVVVVVVEEGGTGRTVQFALYGINYEIDFIDDNADSLREAFST